MTTGGDQSSHPPESSSPPSQRPGDPPAEGLPTGEKLPAGSEQALAVEVSLRRDAEARLRESEKFHRSLIEQVRDYAIFRTDPQGRATTWNKGVERVLGFKEDEFIGKDITHHIFTPEDIQNGVPQRELEEARRTGVGNNDRWMQRKDGTRFYAEGVTTALRDEADNLTGFTKVMRDHTRQKQQADELKEKTRQLALANEQKDHFLAVLSHELRNPLAAIRSATDLLCVEADDKAPLVRETCEILVRQVEVMVRLVNDLLDASRITSGKVRLRKEAIDLRDVASRAVTTVRPLVGSRRQDLAVSLPSEAVSVEADAVRIEQVIVNLLTNAAKYTPEEGNIWLTLEREDDQAVIRVRDNGEGIAAEVMPTLFTLFSQADRSADQSQGGMGIGLALVRSLTTAHGGTLEVTSEGLGKGSEFTARLPLSGKTIKGTAPAAPEAPASGSRRLLIVDDNADAARLLSILLGAQGYDVRTELSGPAGLETAASFRPHAVILDIGMPGMDGYELARRLRELPDFRQVRLIAVSGYGRDADREKSKAAGIDRHLVKPVERHDLLVALEALKSPAS